MLKYIIFNVVLSFSVSPALLSAKFSVTSSTNPSRSFLSLSAIDFFKLFPAWGGFSQPFEGGHRKARHFSVLLFLKLKKAKGRQLFCLPFFVFTAFRGTDRAERSAHSCSRRRIFPSSSGYKDKWRLKSLWQVELQK